ncbi:MAG TPA: hypothetical protein VKT78_00140 [Fimbriimonadaceae bacterium]|nr:hypothetical protein [Fimbriimonadaceae bacterium]
MKHIPRAIVCLALFACAALSFDQGPTDKAAASDKVIDHIRQADLLNHLLPILWTKGQLNAILPSIEKARQTVELAHDNEYHKLMELDPKVSAAVDKALNDGNLPGRDLLKGVNDQLNTLQVTRTILGKRNEGLVYDALTATLNSGQKKAMANDLDPSSVTPGLKVETMSDEEKIRFYIRNILLDPLTYDLLVKLQRSPAIQG